MNQTKPYPVLLAGGVGTRLWPMSTTEHPKQFARLLGDYSLFQQTAMRYTDNTMYNDLIVITGEKYEDIVEQQMNEIIGNAEYHIVTEKQRRDTGPAIFDISQWLWQRDRQAVALVVPSDHYIGNMAEFHLAVERGMKYARDGIVIFGIEPTSYETGYGYIKQGQALGDGCYQVDQFKEKPDLETAVEYVNGNDRYTWNSGIYLFSVEAMIAAFLKHAPKVFTMHPPTISIDVAISEPHAKQITVVETAIDWNDVGSWAGVLEVVDRDTFGNHSRGGNDTFNRSFGCLAFTQIPVIMNDCHDIGVIETEDVVLILALKESQRIKFVASNSDDYVHSDEANLAIECNKKMVCVGVENLKIVHDGQQLSIESLDLRKCR